jgi:hypothetical protein
MRSLIRAIVQEIYQKRSMANGPFELDGNILRTFANERLAKKRNSWQHDSAEFTARYIADNLESDEDMVVNFQGQKHVYKHRDLAQKTVDKVKGTINAELDSIRNQIGPFWYDADNILISMFDQHEFDEDNLHPFPIYLCASNDVNNSIGIMALGGGKYEMFEENEETDNDTYVMANKLLGLGGQKKKVYAAHNEELVLKIKKENRLPEGLYVSPDREYARGYFSMQEQRVLFSCEVAMDDIRMESHVDWKTARETTIGKFNWIGNI